MTTLLEKQPKPSTAPRTPLPAGACDCHIHISDANGRYPIIRKTHEPLHATSEACTAMLKQTGLQRAVAVQLMAYGNDNDAMLHALHAHGGTLRGVAELPADASDAVMEALHAAGVRGLRFYLEPPKAIPGLQFEAAGLRDLDLLAPRMRAFGWSAEISAGCELIAELAPKLSSLGLPIVLEHMAGCTASRGIADHSVRRVLEWLASGAFWVKLTACAMSDSYPDYEDLRPVHESLVRAAPDRMLWGSNWPHAMPGTTPPESGHLLDLFDAWLDHDEALRTRILCENPAQLFDFQQAR